MKFYHLTIAHLLVALCLCAPCFGQWKLLKSFDAQVDCVHFLDREGYTQIGYAGLINGEVWRTIDSGATWVQTTTPASLIGSVRDFSFKDSLNGWLAMSLMGSNLPSLFSTTDAGMTWSPVLSAPKTTIGTGVYYNPLGTGVLILTEWLGGLVSTDLGATWTPIPGTANMNMCGISFTDTLNGLITVFPTSGNPANYFTTSDGGITWVSRTQKLECWQPLGIKGSHTYFTAAEGVREFLRSDDSGKSWRVINTFASTLDITGDLRGDIGAMYIQTKQGIQYTLDTGHTWTDYCGPGNDFDTRFYVIGDSVVYASTIDGGLWVNPFGVKKNKLLVSFPPPGYTLTSNGCKSVDSLYRITNISNCLPVTVTSVFIQVSNGSKQFSLKSPSVPHTVADTSIDTTIKITYTPLSSQLDSATVEIQYTIGTQSFKLDQKIYGAVKSGFNVILSKDLNLLLSSDCSKLDTFVTVKSNACAPDSILNITIDNTTAFNITTPAFPVGIPTSGSFKIPVSIAQVPAGQYSATITITILSGGITRDTTIKLSAQILSASEPKIILSPNQEKFGTVSVCDVVTDTITMKNTLCKKLYIKNVSVSPAPAASQFNILNAKSLPDSLNQNDTAIAIIQYKPTVGGNISGTVCFAIGFDLVNTKDTCINISGTGKALPGAGLGQSLLNFPAIVPCTQQQLSTELINNGCGYDTVVGIINTKDPSFSVLTQAPITIASGDSTLIKIQEDPLSPKALFDSAGVIIHSSTGSIDTIFIKLAGIVNQPVHKLDLAAIVTLDSLAPCTAFDTTLLIRNLGTCDTITVNTLNISGANWIVLANATTPAKILPGGSFTYTLHLTPGAKANGNSTVTVKGAGIDTTITIHADSRSGGSPLSVTVDSIFASSLCKVAVNTITLQNSSCDPIIIDKLSLQNLVGSQFSLTPALTLPITISPGGKQDIIISFDPTAPGDSTATLNYTSTASGISRTITLKGKLSTSKQTARLGIVTAGNLTTASVLSGRVFTISIILQDKIDPTLGLNAINATLSYYKDVLGATGNAPTAGPGWTLAPTTVGNGSCPLALTPNGATGLAAGSVLANVQFEAFVADSAYTPIDLQNIQFNNNDPAFNSCVLSPLGLQTPFMFQVLYDCGDTVLRGFLRGDRSVFTSIKIRPNPAAIGTQINLSLQLNQRSDVSLVITDALGRTVSRTVKPSVETGLQNFLLDLPKNASGLYVVSVEAGGMRASEKIVVQE
jgi:photosystem II stability/assembly factor-like uncharacterized protein